MQLLQIAYTLLTIAFISSVIVAVVRLEQDEPFAPIPALLFATICANIVRHRLGETPTLALDVFTSRTLFMVWPIGTAFVLLWAFNKRKMAGWVFVFAGLLITALGCIPYLFANGRIVIVAQAVAAFDGVCAIGLALFVLARVPTKLSPFETAAFLCAIGEGTAAMVGHLVKGHWWPAVIVYCVLYVALIVLHARVLWGTMNSKSLSPNSSSEFSR
jgi:hypothetical protein